MADALILAIVVTIGGVDRTTYLSGTLTFSMMVNGIGQARFEVWDPSGAWMPAEGMAVSISLGGTERWAGEIDAVEITYLGIGGGIKASVVAQHVMQLLQRDVVDTTFPAGTEKALLQALLATGTTMAGYGITLDPAQPDGSTLTEVAAPVMTPEAVLQYVSTQTGDIYAMTSSRVLGMWAPGAKSSGATISISTGTFIDARWTRHRFDYRNTQTIRYGEPGTTGQVWTVYTGDGSTRRFRMPCIGMGTGLPLYCAVKYGSGGWTYLPVEWFPGDGYMGGSEFMYDAATDDLVQQLGATLLTVSDQLGVMQAVLYPQSVTEHDAAEVSTYGVWGRADAMSSITMPADARVQAQALITRNKPRPRIPIVTTTQDGLLPGYTIVIDLPVLDLSSATCLIQQIDATCIPSGTDAEVEYSLTLAAATEKAATIRDIWSQLLGTGPGGSSMGSGSGGAPTGGGSTVVVALRAHLGGSRADPVPAASWAPITNYGVFRATMDGVYTFRVEVMTTNAATSVHVRLYDLTAAAAVADGTLSTSTSTTWVEQLASVALVAGHRYRAEIQAGNTSYPVLCGQATVEA